MSYRREREEFIARMATHGVDVDTARTLLRYSSTLQRLAVASCNGDWPADNGERKVKTCPKCEGGWIPSSFRRIPRVAGAPKTDPVCPDCYWSAKAAAAVPSAFRAVFQGDPRGAVFRLVPAGTPDADVQSGRERGIYVPAKG